MQARVLLVHGLWMHAPALLFWHRRLKKAGFQPELFSYASLWQSPERAMERLRKAAMAAPNTHIVAHSLGGLISVKALASTDFKGKVICVGSPMAGSQVIRRYAATPLRVLGGRSVGLLCAGVGQIPTDLHVSMIAGTESKGLGRIFHRFSEPNDGSVALSETIMPGLAQHETAHVSHSGQLFSRAVMDSAVAMLRHDMS